MSRSALRVALLAAACAPAWVPAALWAAPLTLDDALTLAVQAAPAASR
jgi:hypothetical protein